MKVPREYELCDPTVQALRSLGGVGSIEDIERVVIQKMRFPEELVWQPHGNAKQTELQYRLAWARTVLKTCGLVDNPKRRIWSLTEKGARHPLVDSYEIRKRYLENKRDLTSSGSVAEPDVLYEYLSDEEEDELWNRMVSQQFLAGYAETDSVYDSI